MPVVFTVDDACPYWERVVRSTPLVHCMTNLVAVNFTANALLAVGASPAMVIAPEEVEAFTSVADNLCINVGTLTQAQCDSMHLAVSAARNHAKPWVLDPVAVGDVLSFRSDFVQKLLAYQPAVIRANAGEILWLVGEEGQSRGADSLSGSDDALASAQMLAKQQRCVVVVTGERDYVTDGELTFCIEGGSVLQTRLTACGCALSALVAAFVAQGETLSAAAAACAVMKQAGAHAAAHSQGMGSFATALLDGLTYEQGGKHAH